MSNRWEIPLPPANEAVLLAKKLASGNLLRLRILQALMGHPQRYSELRPTLGGKGDELLTRALKELVAEGVLDQRSDIRKKPPVDSYELSDLGSRVVLALAERAALERLARSMHGDRASFVDAFQA